MAENLRGYHHPNQRNFESGGTGQGREEPPAQGRAGMKEPTNHAGHTHEMARRHEHDRRVEATRRAHNSHHHEAPGAPGVGMHKHLVGDAHEHEQTKHGGDYHWRGKD